MYVRTKKIYTYNELISARLPQNGTVLHQLDVFLTVHHESTIRILITNLMH